MRYSAAFIPTLREAPNDATTPSHVLLLRSGMVRMVGAGIYEFLPLGFRVLTKIANIVREEMNRAGAQEVMMPALLPREYFEESGRWSSFGDTLLRLTDRKKGDYHLGPTHEEIITDMVRRDVKSYRQLPLNLYQIQTKFRDEARPRAGLLRCREFIMKDAYSFDVSEENAVRSYEQMREAYVRVFTRLGLEFRLVSADSGAMGGSTSAEFQVLAQNGEDAIVACTACQYAANVEVATTTAPAAFAGSVPAPEKVATPGKKTIEEVAGFLGVPASATLKALFYRVIGEAGVSYALCFVRGDHSANEVKLLKALREAGVSAKEVVLGEDAELRPFGGVTGYIGPVGLSPAKHLTVLIDREGATGAGFVVGANEAGFHTKHVAFGRDFTGAVCDVRQVGDGDGCPSCGGALKSYRGIEGGHIFVLGTHYSGKMKCTFLDEKGEEKPIVMGCYGIGVSRLVATAIEQHHDGDGIVWPMSIAPFQVALVTAGKEPELLEAAQKLYAELTAAGVEVLFDDRDERPGVKFKDADLLGLPLRVVVGKKSLAEGKVEIKARASKTAELVAASEAAAHLVARIEAGGVRLVKA
jgi:prolyl-tRNA synthetase